MSHSTQMQHNRSWITKRKKAVCYEGLQNLNYFVSRYVINTFICSVCLHKTDVLICKLMLTPLGRNLSSSVFIMTNRLRNMPLLIIFYLI